MDFSIYCLLGPWSLPAFPPRRGHINLVQRMIPIGAGDAAASPSEDFVVKID